VTKDLTLVTTATDDAAAARDDGTRDVLRDFDERLAGAIDDNNCKKSASKPTKKTVQETWS
jgi:hypothetical protein